MEPTASFTHDAVRGPLGPARAGCILRLGLVALVWGAIGYIHAQGAPLAYLWASVALSTALGLGILHLAGEDTRWTGMLAAVLLVTSPLLQKAWALPPGPASDRVMLAKTLLMVGGLLLLARLGAGPLEAEETTQESAAS